MDENLLDHSPDLGSEELPPEASNSVAVAPISQGIETLPISLEIRLKEKRVTLRELVDFQPDTVIPFGLDLKEEVSLFANNMNVGSGHLVQVGDRVGVQIDSWAIREVKADGTRSS